MSETTTDIAIEIERIKNDAIYEMERAKALMLRDLSGIDKCTLAKLREILKRFSATETNIIAKINAFDLKIQQYLNGALNQEEFRAEMQEIRKIISELEGGEVVMTTLEELESRIAQLEENTSSGVDDETLTDIQNRLTTAEQDIDKNAFNIEGNSNSIKIINNDKAYTKIAFTPNSVSGVSFTGMVIKKFNGVFYLDGEVTISNANLSANTLLGCFEDLANWYIDSEHLQQWTLNSDILNSLVGQNFIIDVDTGNLYLRRSINYSTQTGTFRCSFYFTV